MKLQWLTLRPKASTVVGIDGLFFDVLIHRMPAPQRKKNPALSK